MASKDMKMKNLLGFEAKDLSSWSTFCKLMNRPCDPASLGVWRLLFGLLMILDLPQERGLAYADIRWGDERECRFPLFDFLVPLPLEWMYGVYLIALAGAFGLMTGFCYRFSCLILLIPYWYIFFLDKCSWNNHSYLYGLTIFLFLLTDGNRYFSIDGSISKNHRHIPLWNYAIFRLQFFLLYFVAGLKKLDADWVSGYSMQNLSKHWVFAPFQPILSHEQIDLYLVHGGGLILDLSAGYLLFFDKTRPFATLFVSSFHLMNSQLFNIGMFPFTCLCATPLFYGFSWPRNAFAKIMKKESSLEAVLIQPSAHCIYTKEFIKSDSPKKDGQQLCEMSKVNAKSVAGFYHKVSTCFFVMYAIIQCFLPYSHGLTKGYNNWTNGLYGYSWDMMVHSWSLQHVRITATGINTGETLYLDPKAWTENTRWTSHADMIKQYAACIQHRLAEENVDNFTLNFDIYKSLNDRFQQRMVDPRVNILTAEWSAFKDVDWIMPLLTDLSDWRKRLFDLENNVYEESNYTDVLFIADFPGLFTDQYIPDDLDNTTITMLYGEVIVELNDQKKNFTLKENDHMPLPAGEFHSVHTVSSKPSCYMYIYVNTTEKVLVNTIMKYSKKSSTTETLDMPKYLPFGNIPTLTPESIAKLREENPKAAQLYSEIQSARQMVKEKTNFSLSERFHSFVQQKYKTFSRACELSLLALKSIWLRKSMNELLKNYTTQADDIE